MPAHLQRIALPRPDAPDGRDAAYLKGADIDRGGAVPVVRVPPGGTADLGTWLNAAPLGWWRELLGIDTVRLVVHGHGHLTVLRAGPSGTSVLLDRDVDGEVAVEVSTGDATWAWTTLGAGADGGVLEAATWEIDGASDPLSFVTVVVPTFRREDDCREQVGRLTSDNAAATVGRVVVVDQGGTFVDAPDVRRVLAAAGERAVLLEQPNLGGSGGYGRGMLESERWPDDPVLLLDDDAEIDLEVLRRLHVLTSLLDVPTVLGTGLLSAERPTSLEALAEGIEPRTFRWGPVDGVGDGVGDGVDVSRTGPAGWGFARPTDRAEYTGWWGTLVPAGAVRRVGLPAPYFLKWDDAEWGLRAGRAGLRVATVPGSAVWHPTWAAKGTISSWSAWPLHRNRLATAAAYGAGRGVLRDSLVHQVKHVLSLQYDTAALWDAALAEVLDGPDWLDDDLTAVRPRAQQLIDAAPSGPDVGGVARAGGPLPLATALVRAVTGLVAPARLRGTKGAVVVEDVTDVGWRIALGRDLVSVPGGGLLVRDPARARALLRRTFRLHARASWQWSMLRRAYASALPAASSREAWAGRFDA
ncbi:glycosyltransferase [Cellulosimicrobium terreum]|nr:glycosyltransferase [Cellulosimicrobium terreum]